jgi:ribonuclease BN (tRNA processing enzyme)
MRLHVLGCGDAFGSGGRHQSSYLFEASDRLFLLDCGATALLAMKRAGFAPRDLDAIILSHLHGDHFGGIPFFMIEYLHQSPPHSPVTIAGPPGTGERVMQLCNLMYGSGKSVAQEKLFNFQILRPEETATIKEIEILPFRVPHQTEDISLALKVGYDGQRVLFSGDSAWTDQFIEQARGVDLFLCECSFFTAQPAMHIDYQTLRANFERLQCKKLILTHLGEEMLARKNQLEMAVAEDGMILSV